MRNAIILDDEMLAIERMQNLLEKDGRIEVAGIFQNAEEAIDYCSSNDVDIVFSDIEMPRINGINFGKILNEKSQKSILVYITAYSQYTLEAYENNAVGYLLKPIIPEKLTRIIDIIFNIKSLDYSTNDKLIVKSLGSSSFKRGEKIVSFRTKKAEELFCYLLHRQGEWTTSESIIDALWPDRDMTHSKKQLHTTVYYCRKALLSVELENIIEYQHGKYRLNINYVEWDYLRLYNKINKYLYRNITEKEYLEVIKINSGFYFGSYCYEWASETQYHLDALLQQFFDVQKDNHNIPKRFLKIGDINDLI
jgi:two-component SAPR family response regulator